jgi:hypothetical protein
VVFFVAAISVLFSHRIAGPFYKLMQNFKERNFHLSDDIEERHLSQGNAR